MNGFDFDGTLYRGDSTLDFFLFALRNRPKCLFALPEQLTGAALFAMSRISRDEFKEHFYRFIARIEDVDDLVASFWRKNIRKTYARILERTARHDLVISASPAFLLKPFCEQAELALIASEVDSTTGALLGPNCRGEEKVRRFRQSYGNLTLDEFYTDSLIDAPMTYCAKSSYLVKHGAIEPFPDTPSS